MKVLVIGRDPKIFDESSENFLRIRKYAGLFEELHIISVETRGKEARTYGNLYIYPASATFLLCGWCRAFWLARQILIREHIEILDAQDAGIAGLLAFLLSRLYRIPFRVQIHADIMSPLYRSGSTKERIWYWFALFLVPRAGCIRVVSERIKKSLEARFKNLESRITVLPIFTDITRFTGEQKSPATEKRLKDFDFKMIAVGRFVDKEKNFSMLIDMMRDFVKVCPKSILVIVGEGPDRERYQLQVRSYKLEKNVTIERWRDDLPSFYKSFDLFLLSSNYEGWGRAVIEAMASGLSVVMTDVGLAGEVVWHNQNGLVVSPQNREAFFLACRELFSNKQKKQQLAESARRTIDLVSHSTWEEYVSHYKLSFLPCVKK